MIFGSEGIGALVDLIPYPRFGVWCFILKLSEHIWSERWDSNPQPTDWKSVTLPLSYIRIFGADTGNRTRTQSVAHSSSTIKLHLHMLAGHLGIKPS